MPLSLEQLLERSRKELLDLSTRNRLLSIPVGAKSARVVQVHDELSSEVFRLLVREKKAFSFLPGHPARSTEGEAPDAVGAALTEENADAIEATQPDDEDTGTTESASRHVNSRLQTSLSPEGLQARLLGLFRDAQTMLEEQGVNILFLALGHLKWFEAEQAETARYAPLVLVPVQIQRKSAGDKFYVRCLDEDVQENLSLRARLKGDFDLDLPEFAEEEEFDIRRYFEAVAQAIRGVKGWEVLPNAMTLGFFSFAKFLMYRDLDPKNWPAGSNLLQHPFISGLLQDGFPQVVSAISDQSHLDELIPVARLDHIVDADSSQTLAIEAVRQGQSMVIQGPPGTGKSQSIANIIATAVLDGKKVLFVAEKLAALEVVKRRLEKVGLGELCLELHSNKSSKRAVVEQIGSTWNLGRPKDSGLEALVPKLEGRRELLNRHVQALHERRTPSGLTPFEVLGQLTLLGDRGSESADVTFIEAEDWTPDDRQERRQLIGELAERIEDIGVPSKHPWRGVGCDVVLKIDLDPLAKSIRCLQTQLALTQESSVTLAAALVQPVPETFQDLENQERVAKYVGSAPLLDKQALCNSVWNAGLEDLSELIAAGKKFSETVAATSGRVVESAWEQDLTDARAHIAAHGESWFRFLQGDYRRALARLRGILVGALPPSYEARVALADQIIAGQSALRTVRNADALGQAAFGAYWRKEKTQWSEVELIFNWVSQQRSAGLGEEFRRLFSGVPDPKRVVQLCGELSTRLAATRDAVAKVFEPLRLDCAQAFGVTEVGSVSLSALAERSTLWLANLEELSRWNHYFVRARRARELGCAALVERFDSGALLPGAALDGFDRAYLGQLLRHFMRELPGLAEFDGVLHDRRIEEFRKLDCERLALSRHRVVMAHFDNLPAATGVGPAGIVRGEMERKRGHRPVRRLLKDAGTVVQAIKPVFMMSPLSVAQFLEPGAVEFDLLVVDEASQVQPVDALGAIARCRQIVVVGDSRQLPPTRFFARMTTDLPELDDEAMVSGAAEVRDIESILGLCCARGLPQSMLRWHYRSRHHSLIAVSNHEFYEDRLFIVPSPYSSASGLGLRFNHVPQGVFDSGASGTNAVEARAVSRAVIDHARKSPELSLGVAAFSVRQQQAILDELEILRRENPDTEGFFSEHATEPFFVKNLENVQGDERDVILISVGYGKDAQGYLAMRFGPLSIEGGERRLNVLISRAKKRCEVFSSILPEDIDLERASGRGVAAFRTFLSYARTGLLGNVSLSGREEDSPFEEAVRLALEALGHKVHPQVGVAGFFIDLAICHPQQPGHYLLGIECDGAPYHSARSARDRDRLRQAVLEDHGWIIHRIWSTDWFQRPAEQLQKVQKAFQRALALSGERSQPDAKRTTEQAEAASIELIERERPMDPQEAGLSELSVPYREAKLKVPDRKEPHEVSTEAMAEIVMSIVQHEGPVHEDEIVARVRDLWGLGRAGTRVQEAVAKAIQSILARGLCARADGFLSIPGAPVPIRNREAVSSSSLRKPDLLPPAEISEAIFALIDAHHGATPLEIPVAVARIFGFKTTSSQLRSAIDAQVNRLQRDGAIEECDGMFKRVK